eukprot:51724_1
MIPDHMLKDIISFVRGSIPLDEITAPKELMEAHGEINIRGELEGYCYLKYKDGTSYVGKMANGETEGTYEYIVQAWSITIGFTHLKLQENKSFALVLDDKYEINFGFIQHTKEILVACYLQPFKVQDLDHEKRYELYDTLLKANFAFNDTGKGTLGICPKGEQVVFSMSRELRYLNVTRFQEMFDHVVKMSEKWDKQLTQMFK